MGVWMCGEGRRSRRNPSGETGATPRVNRRRQGAAGLLGLAKCQASQCTDRVACSHVGQAFRDVGRARQRQRSSLRGILARHRSATRASCQLLSDFQTRNKRAPSLEAHVIYGGKVNRFEKATAAWSLSMTRSVDAYWQSSYWLLAYGALRCPQPALDPRDLAWTF